MGTKITAIGYSLPPVEVSNQRWRDEFATKHEISSNEFTRFISDGIERRYYMEAGASVADLGAKAVIDCLTRANLAPDRVEHILHVSNVGDSFVNGDGGKIQHLVGATRASTLDLTGLACSGFVIALGMATALIESGRYNNVLISCVANPASRAADHRDVAACSLGDLGTAILVQKTQDESGVRSYVHRTNAKHYDLHRHKRMPEGKRTWEADRGQPWGEFFLFVDPREGALASRQAAEDFIPSAGAEAMRLAGMRADDMRWFVSHQPGEAPMKIWDNVLGFDKSKHPDTLAEVGNASVSTVPFTLCRLMERNAVKPGDHLLLLAPGSGYQVGAIVWRW